MAKCSNCDYPYVPKSGLCSECGKDNSYDSGSNSEFDELFDANFWKIIGAAILIGSFFYIYKEFTFDEDDLIEETFVFKKNLQINFSSYEYYVWKLGSDGFPDGYCIGGYGAWKIKDNKLILESNGSDCPEIRTVKGVYSRDDLKKYKKK